MRFPIIFYLMETLSGTTELEAILIHVLIMGFHSKVLFAVYLCVNL